MDLNRACNGVFGEAIRMKAVCSFQTQKVKTVFKTLSVSP